MKIQKSQALLIGWMLVGLGWWPARGWARTPARAAPPGAGPRVRTRRPPPAPPPGKARARPAVKLTRRARPTRTVVMLAARNQSSASKELHQAVSGQLSDASVALELRWVKRFASGSPAQLAQARKIASGRRVVVVFWCDLSAKKEIFLYLVEPSAGRLIVRSVARAGGGGRAESVAIIVGMSVRAILGSLPRSRARPRARPARARRNLAHVLSRSPGETSARRPSMPLSPDNPLFAEGARLERRRGPRRPHWLALELGYALDFYGKKEMADGATYPASSGASIGLSARITRRWSAFVSFRVTEPIKAKGDPVQTSLQRYPLSAGGRVRFQLGRWVELSGALSFTFDYVAVDTKAPVGWTPLANQNELHYLIGAEIRVAILAVERLRIHLALGAEVGLNPILRRIDFGDEDKPIIIDPWPVQPYLRLGIALDMI